jgi:hypothetical protein
MGWRSGGDHGLGSSLHYPSLKHRASRNCNHRNKRGDIGDSFDELVIIIKKLHSGEWKKGSIPELWDGNAGDRIVKELLGLPLN